MSLVTVHGSNTMYVESGFQPDSSQGTGDLYQTITYVAGGAATFGGTGSREPESLPELREYDAADISPNADAWATDSYVAITSPSGAVRNYYWDGDEWQSGIAP